MHSAGARGAAGAQRRHPVGVQPGPVNWAPQPAVTGLLAVGGRKSPNSPGIILEDCSQVPADAQGALR